jgi:hypothetical protein
MLTPAQQAALKAAILADPTLNAFPNTSDGNFDLCAQKLNVNASPAFIVWKTQVSLNEVGLAFDGAELSNLVTANTSRLQVRAAFQIAGENPAIASTRTFYDQVFSVGGITRTNLAALWKRSALLGEKILATGTGSDPNPATLGYVGMLNPNDVAMARSS